MLLVFVAKPYAENKQISFAGAGLLRGVAFLSQASRSIVCSFGYKIGKRVRIGLSIIDAGECTIDDDVSIGHFNVVTRVQKIVIKDHVRIGHLNIIRGGDEVSLGRYCEIIRMNEINSIPEPEVVNPNRSGIYSRRWQYRHDRDIK